MNLFVLLIIGNNNKYLLSLQGLNFRPFNFVIYLKIHTKMLLAPKLFSLVLWYCFSFLFSRLVYLSTIILVSKISTYSDITDVTRSSSKKWLLISYFSRWTLLSHIWRFFLNYNKRKGGLFLTRWQNGK